METPSPPGENSDLPRLSRSESVRIMKSMKLTIQLRLLPTPEQASLLLGTMRREWRRGVDHGEMFREIVPAHRRRPDLWGLVMDCLEVVAWKMRLMGAVYVHTDGVTYIVDSYNSRVLKIAP